MQDQEIPTAAGGMAPSAATTQTAALTASDSGDAAISVKDPKRLLAPARLLVLLSLGFAILGFGSDSLELQLLHKIETGAFVNDAEMMNAADANDQRQLIVYVPYLVVLIMSFIFVGRWIYHSSKNLRAFGAIGLSFRPGWAVGWYFIPFANLWKPYQAMKEIWQASSNPLDWHRQEIPGLMPVWWTLWLIAGFVDRASYRLASRAETIADLKFAIYVSLVSGGLSVALCPVFVILMSRISRLQVDAMQNKSTLAVFGP